jgi:hypothetical protein
MTLKIVILFATLSMNDTLPYDMLSAHHDSTHHNKACTQHNTILCHSC